MPGTHVEADRLWEATSNSFRQDRVSGTSWQAVQTVTGKLCSVRYPQSGKSSKKIAKFNLRPPHTAYMCMCAPTKRNMQEETIEYPLSLRLMFCEFYDIFCIEVS